MGLGVVVSMRDSASSTYSLKDGAGWNSSLSIGEEYWLSTYVLEDGARWNFGVNSRGVGKEH